MPKASTKQRCKESTSLTLSELDKVKQTKKLEHGTATNTKLRYDGYIRRGREWLNALVENTKSDEDLGQPWTMIDLTHAFDSIPTRASPWAVAAYMTYKCFEQSNGIATAEGIHAAFKKYWESSNVEGKYHGDWKWDEERKMTIGNPASSPDVLDVLHAIKRKHGADVDAIRNHSAAMSYEYLDRIYCVSHRKCPVILPLPPPEALTLSQRLILFQHLGWRAFSSLSWTIWTRNSEALCLQVRHVIFDSMLQDQNKLFFWYIVLERRKNWQNKLESHGAHLGMRYRIFPQPDLPAADVDYHMRVWLSFLCSHVYGRPLQANDWLFPSINSNGIVHPQQHMSHEVIQNWIDTFAIAAGITHVRFTTHCFRRGGAQYRFTRAPANKRWSLEVRWWAGWAEGEQADTLMRYLMDDLHSQEHNFEDALAPEKEAGSVSFMNAQKDSQPATYQDIKSMMTSFERAVYLNEKGLSCSDMQNLHLKQPSSSYHHCSCSSTPAEKFSGTTATTTSSTAATPGKTMPLNTSNSPPVGLCIPRLTGLPFPQRWKLVIKQWDEPDPSSGLLSALKDWEPEWISSDVFAMTYHYQKLIALEFIEGRDEALFLQRWPMANQGPTALYNAITQTRLDTGKAKHRKRRGREDSEGAGSDSLSLN